MDRMLGMIIAGDLATPLRSILLIAMFAYYVATDLIDPALPIGIWGRMHIF
jgi:hypothetical protein